MLARPLKGAGEGGELGEALLQGSMNGSLSATLKEALGEEDGTTHDGNTGDADGENSFTFVGVTGGSAAFNGSMKTSRAE